MPTYQPTLKILSRVTANKTFFKDGLIRLWYLSHRRPTKAQASLRIRQGSDEIACIRAVSPEPLLLAHIKYGSRRRVQLKIRYLDPLDGCECAFEV